MSRKKHFAECVTNNMKDITEPEKREKNKNSVKA